MIDLGLTKLAVIGVVALVVIGPEKLPRVARMAGSLFGRAQRYIHDVKQEVSREIDLEEFRNMQNEVREAASTVEQSIHQNASEVRDAVSTGWNDDFTGATNPLLDPPMPDQHGVKAKNFRKKKLQAIRDADAPETTAADFRGKVRGILRDKRERVGRNPKTGIEVPITRRRVMTFRASQKLKDRIVKG